MGKWAWNGAGIFFPYQSRPCRHFGRYGFGFWELLFLYFSDSKFSNPGSQTPEIWPGPSLGLRPGGPLGRLSGGPFLKINEQTQNTFVVYDMATKTWSRLPETAFRTDALSSRRRLDRWCLASWPCLCSAVLRHPPLSSYDIISLDIKSSAFPRVEETDGRKSEVRICGFWKSNLWKSWKLIWEGPIWLDMSSY